VVLNTSLHFWGAFKSSFLFTSGFNPTDGLERLCTPRAKAHGNSISTSLNSNGYILTLMAKPHSPFARQNRPGKAFSLRERVSRFPRFPEKSLHAGILFLNKKCTVVKIIMIHRNKNCANLLSTIESNDDF